ncbi:FtsH protease activity modulator HflK [Candidatus Methylocalor cossyra]|uniref:Protein HflK n=1 Tax=Candidatus Methylocalor cossyra TaxID=3108543 RepID=A0ABM9NHN7_9GAMM
MSWNEPGSNKKDPWSGRDQQETPPDLEELMRGLQERIHRIFGKGLPGTGGANAPAKTIGLIVTVVLVLWGLTGIYLVDEGSRGVVTRFGRYIETTMPGLHWHIPAPIDKVEIVNVEQQRFMEIGYRSGGRQQSLGSVPKEALMLTQDENIIDIRLAVQYQIKDAKAYLFNVAEPDVTLKEVIESAQRAVIGKSTMDFVLTEGRGQIADNIKSEVQHILDQYQTGLRVTNVSLVDAQPPEQVQSAFEDAIKAREDEQRLKNDAEAYRNEVVPKARGAAARLLEESEAYKQKAISKAEGEAARFRQLLAEYEKAPEVTRERLYLDAMQEVFEQTGTVLVDVKRGNNVIYLPVDRLGKSPASASQVRDADTPPVGQELSESGARNVRSTTARGREGRGQ